MGSPTKLGVGPALDHAGTENQGLDLSTSEHQRRKFEVLPQPVPEARLSLARHAGRREVFDVAVDLRRSSPTFKQWYGIELSASNFRQLWLPAGFAHGFLVLSDSADFLYKTTDYYQPTDERAIRWDDPTLAVEWPLAGVEPNLSAKDSAAPLFDVERCYP